MVLRSLDIVTQPCCISCNDNYIIHLTCFHLEADVYSGSILTWIFTSHRTRDVLFCNSFQRIPWIPLWSETLYVYSEDFSSKSKSSEWISYPFVGSIPSPLSDVNRDLKCMAWTRLWFPFFRCSLFKTLLYTFSATLTLLDLQVLQHQWKCPPSYKLCCHCFSIL